MVLTESWSLRIQTHTEEDRPDITAADANRKKILYRGINKILTPRTAVSKPMMNVVILYCKSERRYMTHKSDGSNPRGRIYGYYSKDHNITISELQLSIMIHQDDNKNGREWCVNKIYVRRYSSVRCLAAIIQF